MNPNLRKIQAFRYYFYSDSPTFMNALRSLTKAGYSYNYARSYGSKVFLMDRWVNSDFVGQISARLSQERKVNNG